uniref:Ferredoxin n=1 Tax=Heterorhabditis bacteriophora TaxID=37862 RepID=A0A1I7WW66_HETBA
MGLYTKEVKFKQIADVCPQLTQRHKDERLCWAKIFMRCN